MPKLTHEICLVCGKQAVAHKLCEKHYRKMRRYGTPEPNTAYGKKYRNHPLYERWRGTGRSVVDRVQEWESFEIFLKDVREPPDLKYRLMRPNETKPYGPNNFKWVEPLLITANWAEDKNGYAREFRKIKPHLTKKVDLRRNYGITFEDYEKKLKEQNGVCAICKRPETIAIRGSTLSLAIDHNHNTGQIRGLLCGQCNMSLGGFKDSQELLLNATEYLNKWEAALTSAPSLEYNIIDTQLEGEQECLSPQSLVSAP